MKYPSLTVFEDPELAHRYASTSGVRYLRVSGDDRKQLAMMIAIGGQVEKGGAFALTFDGPHVSISVGRMMLRILLGKGAVSCCSGQFARFCPTLPLHGLAIVAPSNDLRQLLSILGRIATSNDKIPRNPGIGRWSEDSVLLVGDRPSSSWPLTAPDYPFLSALSTGCSGWLAQHLDDSGVSEAQLYWTNAYTQDGKPHPHDWIEVLEPRGVIALGGAAKGWLDGSGVRADYQVYHPQYWKRFQAGKTYVLGRYLKKLLSS